MKKRNFLYISLLIMALLTGCSSQDESQEAAQQHHHTANGDLQEVTSSITQLPRFLEQSDEKIAQVYSLAANHQELLAYMPCYCGCGESAGHQHNLHCFIHEIKDDGQVVWDDHATRCGVCLEIAYVASQLEDQGKSVTEIRTLIDEAYKEGFAAPTKTPMP